nr:MAG TPA: hypothetical protein [Caudoviricetes sp.]
MSVYNFFTYFSVLTLALELSNSLLEFKLNKPALDSLSELLLIYSRLQPFIG